MAGRWVRNSTGMSIAENPGITWDNTKILI